MLHLQTPYLGGLMLTSLADFSLVGLAKGLESRLNFTEV